MINLLLEKIPLINDWIDKTLAQYAEQSKPVEAFGFDRLPMYYTRDLLASAKVVVADKVPVPPLSQLGLSEFSDFEMGNYDGITFKNVYFVTSKQAENESLHFHELVHVVQWKILGAQEFLRAYALGLLQFGYRNSPLEAMAYNHQTSFESVRQPYNVERRIDNELMNLRSALGS